MFKNKMKVVWYNWVATLLLIFAYLVCAFAGAVASDSKATSFIFIWNMLLLLAYGVGGTFLLRKVNMRTPLSLGFFIGASVLFMNLLLENAVVAASNMAKFGGLLTLDGGVPSAVQAVTAFSIILILDLIPLTAFLIAYRDTILPPPGGATNTENLPQPAFGGASGFPAGEANFNDVAYSGSSTTVV